MPKEASLGLTSAYVHGLTSAASCLLVPGRISPSSAQQRLAWQYHLTLLQKMHQVHEWQQLQQILTYPSQLVLLLASGLLLVASSKLLLLWHLLLLALLQLLFLHLHSFQLPIWLLWIFQRLPELLPFVSVQTLLTDLLQPQPQLIHLL